MARRYYRVEDVHEALRRADLDEATVTKILGTILGLYWERLQLRGRPPEDDAERLARMAELVSIGINRWRAAGMVTEDLEEPARTTARRRVNRKFGTGRQ